MNTTLPNPALSAQIQVIRDVAGNGSAKRAIRRAILINRCTGLLHELPTVYALRTLGKKALNTQLAALYDLAFFLEWIQVRSARSKTWVRPENRIRAGHLALTQNEIDDLSNWCQRRSTDICVARKREAVGIRALSSHEVGVEAATTNRRLRNICSYLCWLTRDMIEGTLMLSDRLIAKSSKYQESLQRAFFSSLSSAKSTAPITSLNSTDSKTFRKVVNSSQNDSLPYEARDRLIGRVLIEVGLRAGELLKIQCEDLDRNFEVQAGRHIAVLKIIKRPNDINDDRHLEPSVKTLPGPVVISQSLADDIIRYITTERRCALEKKAIRRETPYLFVTHAGKRAGLPLTYRNLYRIVSKLGLASALTTPLTPHALRHTHFTDLRDLMAAKGTDPLVARRIMQERGHWSPNSTMPDHYSQRHLAEQQAYFVELRDRILEK